MTVLPRNMFEPGGCAYLFTGGRCKPLPPDVAFIEVDYASGCRVPVTWQEVMERRRKRQAKLLKMIRYPKEPPVVPCYVWVFHNRRTFIYGGWWCYVITRRFEIEITDSPSYDPLKQSIMRAVPLGFLPVPGAFKEWMVELARSCPRGKTGGDPREAGSVVGWLEGRRSFTLAHPGKRSPGIRPEESGAKQTEELKTHV